jgi:RNA polymerase sigma-70 factor (ECF subfamily)
VSHLSEHDFLRVYGETIRPFYAFVARRAGERRLSEDVTQEAWLRAVERWRRDGLPADPLAWLETVGANLLRNHFRREAPQPLESDHLVVDVGTERVQSAGPGAAALLQWGLARLREGQARLLERRHLDGLGLPELAAESGLSVRAVEGRLRRARRDLAKHLSPHLRATGERS